MTKKTGFSYYSIDTDRYQDIRIKRLKKDFGCNGIAVYDYILCEIYRVRGWYLEWDENTFYDVADYFCLQDDVVNGIVNFCGEIGLFDKDLLSEGIISSVSIQRRYQEMSNRAKRPGIMFPEKYIILPEENGDFPEKSDEIPEKTTTKRKEKKSKENNIKEKNIKEKSGHRFSPPTIDEIKGYVLENGYSFDAETFFDFYESKGWFVGKNKMKDWKAAVRNWARGEKERFSRAGGRKVVSTINVNAEWEQ